MRPAIYSTDSDDIQAWDGHSRGESDFCSREGAMALKQKIEAYWQARGHSVLIALHNVGFHPAIRAARFDVRSDMVNGMPRAPQQARQVAPEETETFE